MTTLELKTCLKNKMKDKLHVM